MNDIRFTCKYCGKAIKVSANLSGKQGKCPGCSEKIQIPVVKSAPLAGQSLPSAPLSPVQPTGSTSNSSQGNTSKIIGGVVLLLIVLGTIGRFARPVANESSNQEFGTATDEEVASPETNPSTILSIHNMPRESSDSGPWKDEEGDHYSKIRMSTLQGIPPEIKSALPEQQRMILEEADKQIAYADDLLPTIKNEIGHLKAEKQLAERRDLIQSRYFQMLKLSKTITWVGRANINSDVLELTFEGYNRNSNLSVFNFPPGTVGFKLYEPLFKVNFSLNESALRKHEEALLEIQDHDWVRVRVKWAVSPESTSFEQDQFLAEAHFSEYEPNSYRSFMERTAYLTLTYPDPEGVKGSINAWDIIGIEKLIASGE